MDYEQFFGLSDTPFRLTPDPDYFFASDVHNEALQTLLFAVRGREGFIQITGDPGLGKTVTLRTLLKQLGEEVTTALILNPRLSPEELLKVILEDLGLSPLKMEEKSKEELLRFFREILLEKAQKGINTVLIIDEAQNLPSETLEELRLLSNLETEKKKLLQIILVGQLELEEKLKTPELRQLDQRITIRYRLKPLSKVDTIAYINHRLRIAGGKDNPTFSPRVLKEVYRVTGGVPRLINISCERALMAAFVDGQTTIEKRHFAKAMASIMGEKPVKRRRTTAFSTRSSVVLLGLLLLVAVAGVVFQVFLKDAFSLFMKSQPLVTAVQPPPKPVTPQNIIKKTVPKEEPKEARLQAAAITVGLPAAAHIAEGPPLQALSVPLWPPEAYHVPVGRYFISVHRETNLAYLWQGNEPAPILKGQLKWTEPLPLGLYILGENMNKRPFFFNHPLLFMRLPRLPESQPWSDVVKLLPSNVLPVVSHSSKSQAGAEHVKVARQVRAIVKSWAEDWRKKDIETLINYYASVVTTYAQDNEAPKVYTKNELRQVKKDIFLRSGPISLTVTDPICLIDPSNPEIVMAVFKQTYVSEIYSDDGTNILFFQRLLDKDGKRTWLIVAKLWVAS